MEVTIQFVVSTFNDLRHSLKMEISFLTTTQSFLNIYCMVSVETGLKIPLYELR